MAPVAAAATADCTLATLGSFELRIRGKPVPNPATQKARALLSYLVLHRQTDVPRERLLEVFWPDAEPERARDNLNTALHSIRRGLRTAHFDPNDFIFANKSIVRWDAGVDLDVDRIEAALKSGDETAAGEALARYHGDFLEGDYDEWTVGERERVAGRYEELLTRTVRATKAPDIAKKLLARNPYDEDAYATLIDAELAGGRVFSASQIAAQCRAALQEIGVKPSSKFQEKYSVIERGILKPPPPLEVPFVGRDAEFAELTRAIDREDALAPYVAILEGEPGIGKTALLQRLLQHASAHGLRTRTLRAVCDDARTFAIWPGLYEQLTGKDFAGFVASSQTAIAPELAAAIAANLPEASLLAIDDAQYLTGDALATLVALAKILAAQQQVLLIGTRPEGLVRIIGELGEAAHTVVHLAPLTDMDVDTAMALAGIEMDASTMRVLRARACGHPLYLKGLLEQLVRSGTLRREGMHWELAQPEADLQLPPSLRRLIEARIRARGADAVAVACALALEPSARVSELAHAAGIEEISALDAIDDLLGHHIVIEPRTGPRQFAFAHDLLEETARNLLPAPRRARMHAEFARILSESDIRGRGLRCAVHFECAAQFGQAASTYLQAAQESAEQQAPHDTLDRANAGLRCVDRLIDAPELHAVASRLYQYRSFAHRLLWQLERCMADAEAAVERARASGDLRCHADALIVLKSAIGVSTMQLDKALEVSRELGLIGEKLGDDALVVQSLIDEGQTYRISFDLEHAEPCLRRAFDVATRSGNSETIMKAAIQLLSLQAMWWRFSGASSVVKAVREHTARVEWPFRVHASLVLAMLYTEIECYDEAQKALDSVRGVLDHGTLKRSSLVPNVPRPEIAIRFDYFQAVLDARRGHAETGLLRFAAYRPMYESLLEELRYFELFNAARIDLLLLRNTSGDAGLAAELLPASDSAWRPETGFQPHHAPVVVHARVRAHANANDARALLEQALRFLEQEGAQSPFGLDVAYSRIAESCAVADQPGLALRAAEAAALYRQQKLAESADLVFV